MERHILSSGRVRSDSRILSAQLLMSANEYLPSMSSIRIFSRTEGDNRCSAMIATMRCPAVPQDHAGATASSKITTRATEPAIRGRIQYRVAELPPNVDIAQLPSRHTAKFRPLARLQLVPRGKLNGKVAAGLIEQSVSLRWRRAIGAVDHVQDSVQLRTHSIQTDLRGIGVESGDRAKRFGIARGLVLRIAELLAKCGDLLLGV